MDIDEIRRANIRALELVWGASELAKKAGMSLSQFYNLRDGAKDSKTGIRRGMRKKTAWRIEDAAEVARGYLDVSHDKNEDAEHPVSLFWPFETIPIERFMSLSEKQRARIEGILDARISDEIGRNSQAEANTRVG